MDKVCESVHDLLNNLSISLWGVSDISGLHIYNDKYTRAISLAQGYSYTLDDYSSTGFKEFLLGKVNRELENNINAIKDFLKEENISYYIVSNIQKDSVLLIGEFSHKFAAVRSGLGWIGKNGLLITKEYGPKVRLSTILLDLDLPFNNTQELNGCNGCNICVEICPTKCLKGAIWRAGLEREDLIDIFKCKDKNETKKTQICGLCLAACPIGK